MSHASTCFIALAAIGLLVAVAHGSAIKGHQSLESPVRSVKSLSAPEKVSPKSQATPVQQQQPILESSRKVYNDESIRRSAVKTAFPVEPINFASQPSNLIVDPAPVAPVVAPVAVVQAPVVAAPIQAPVNVPVAEQSAAPVPVVVAAAPAAPLPVESKVESKVEAKSVEQPAAKQQAADYVTHERRVVEVPKVVEAPPKVVESAPVPSDILPAQSDRSVPIKDEIKPEVVQPVSVAVSAAAAVPVDSKAPVSDHAQLMAKKDEPALSVGQQQPVASVAEPAPLAVEVPAPDPGLVLSEPIDSTTKLLIDLDEHVQKFLPAEDKQEVGQPPKEQVLVHGVDYSPASQAEPSGKSALPVSSYAIGDSAEPIVPPLPSLDGVEKASGAAGAQQAQASAVSGGASATRQASSSHGPHQNQQQVITQLLDQLDSLQKRIQDTIDQLVARRRYVMSALLRPMGTYVRRVRTNLERLQTRVNSLQAAAQSVGGGGSGANGQNRPSGFVDAAAIETIRRRIDDISKRISDIVNRIRFSLTPTSAPMNSNGRK